MAQFKDKKDYKQLWHSPLTLLILFCILIIFAYNMIGLIQKEGETRRKKIVELENIENLRKRQSNLDTNIAKLNTDEGVEELIREKYQVAKAGESVINIVDKDSSSVQVPEVKSTQSFWEFIKSLFRK